MPAYNSKDLYNRLVQEQASEAFRSTCIGEESYKKIVESHRNTLYTPNYFIRIALGVLTIIAVLFMGILLGLLFGISGSAQVVILCIFTGVACFGSLELLVKWKKFYNAGTDNILMLLTVILIISSFFVYDYKIDYTLISGVAMVVCLYLCIRFTDAFMAIITYLAFFLFIFLLYLKLGIIAKATVPFVMMMVSALGYFVMRSLEEKESLMIYKFCVRAVMFLTLITFYTSSNYLVVKELSNQMFALNLTVHDGIPMGWLFWVLTFVTPIFYIFYGIKRKNFLFTRTGIGLIGLAIFTVRYYHTILPLEIVILIAGLILIVISYSIIQYLKTPRHGYTFHDLHPENKNVLNIEALIIAQTFGKGEQIESNTLYEGGSGGGGGASGDF